MITNVFDGAEPINVVPTESERKMAKESRGIVKECLSEGESCRLRIIVDGVERDVDIPMTAMRVLGEAVRAENPILAMKSPFSDDAAPPGKPPPGDDSNLWSIAHNSESAPV